MSVSKPVSKQHAPAAAVLLAVSLVAAPALTGALTAQAATAQSATANPATAHAASARALSGQAAHTGPAARRPAVVESVVLGHTAENRPIRAWRVGDPEARVTAVAMATLHGNEPAPRQILRTLRDGPPVHGIDLWLLPVASPDALVRRTRVNARGVDLNRNFPRLWTPQGGITPSGPGPASEPETRALMRFFERVDPRFVVSFHQPLGGIDVNGPKMRWFARRLADHLRMPRKTFACGSGCHGTFGQWFNHRFDGVAVTVELGEHPTVQRLTGSAPRQLLAALGGRT